MVICRQMQSFVELMHLIGPTDGVRNPFNKTWVQTWEKIRNSLGLRFWGNLRLDAPYWRCRNDASVAGFDRARSA
jgi:hypothetical protein